MQSYVKHGAYVGEGTMVATCGHRRLVRADRASRHLRRGSDIGGVARAGAGQPVMFEKTCFYSGAVCCIVVEAP